MPYRGLAVACRIHAMPYSWASAAESTSGSTTQRSAPSREVGLRSHRVVGCELAEPVADVGLRVKAGRRNDPRA